MHHTKIVVIGAGSASFGLNTLSALMRGEKLKGSHIALVDRNPEALGIMAGLAERLNRDWDAEMTLTRHTHHGDALDGADFVVSAIEVPPREKLWQQDYEITLRHGVRQPYAENGGPGGFAHAARNVLPVLEIAHAMEQACPDAWFINFSNPMVRICDAINRYSKIKVVGLCHQIFAGYGMVGYTLANELGLEVPEGEISTHADPDLWPRLGELARQAVHKVDIKAAGLNHFTWMLDLRDRRTGEDLYPLFRERWADTPSWFRAADPARVRGLRALPHPRRRAPVRVSALAQQSGDETVGEVRHQPVRLGAHGPDAQRGSRLDQRDGVGARASGRAEGGRQRRRAGDHRDHLVGRQPLSPGRQPAQPGPDRQPAGECHRRDAGRHQRRGHPARQRRRAARRRGGAAAGARSPSVSLAVDAAVTGDRQKALQCLLLDPVITDMDQAQAILDDYLTTYKALLPQFWQ